VKWIKILLGIVLIGIIALAILVSNSSIKTVPTIDSQRLIVTTEDTNLLLGNKWKVSLLNNKNHFKIVNQQNGQTVFENTPNFAFLSAASAQETVKEYRGSFYFKDKRKQTFRNQSINKITHNDTTLVLEGTLSEGNTSVPYSLAFSVRSTETLRFEFKIQSTTVNRAQLTLKATTAEQITGFGSQFSKYNIKGEAIPVFVSEQGIGKGDQPVTRLVNLMAKSGGSWYTSYATVPFFISSKNYGLSLDNYEYSIFDFKQSEQSKVLCWSNHMTGTLYSANSNLEIIEDYTARTGRMTGLPSWTQDGIILGFQGGTDVVLEKYQKLKKAGAKISGVWIQDWVGQRTSSFGKQLWWNWELDTERYHDWERFKETLRQDSVKILGYINPFLVDVKERETNQRNLFKEAWDKGLLVTDAQGKPMLIKNTSFSSGILDLSNPKCQDWVKAVIKENMIDIGLDGWMADFGEALPYEVTLHDGVSQVYHNKYPEVWAQLNREAIREAGKEDQLFFFSRSGFTNSPRTTTAFWLGDQMVDWGTHDGLKSAVTGLVTAGVSGMSINHSDIGGYTTIVRWPLNITRSEELMIRWSELNVFSSLYRSHEGNIPDANVQLYNNDKAMDAVAYFSQLFSAMKPYRLSLMAEYRRTGKPLVLHPLLLEPENPAFAEYTYHGFFFGNNVYVSPVVEKGEKEKAVDLSKGKWVHVWTDQTFEGGRTVKVAAPLGQPPVFVRDDAALKTVFREHIRKYGLLFNRS